jgi:hypothetical protein
MGYVRLRFEDRLDGASNFFSWRERIGVVLRSREIGNLWTTHHPLQKILNS